MTETRHCLEATRRSGSRERVLDFSSTLLSFLHAVEIECGISEAWQKPESKSPFTDAPRTSRSLAGAVYSIGAGPLSRSFLFREVTKHLRHKMLPWPLPMRKRPLPMVLKHLRPHAALPPQDRVTRSLAPCSWSMSTGGTQQKDLSCSILCLHVPLPHLLSSSSLRIFNEYNLYLYPFPFFSFPHYPLNRCK